ncbi:hypothetical protein ROZALSC1DRAFT_19457 [Rozella allomycis CSF55]|uniref:Helicase ATP-binding domain-containing protein n=1 Tax=Rozella allomycis (strain CSF55) TaxID=988480 RepID=A0A4P9YHJ3_ROZAC|nr:hypothetical protein ROZALSC1DRAFT_19457 [Rozella allomycis CSF55]
MVLNKYKLFPFLIIVPNSTLGNWMNEFSKFCPDIFVVSYYGSGEARKIIREYELWKDEKKKTIKFHVMITTFESIFSDISYFEKIRWEALVIDEGHKLKNDQGKLFKKIIGIKSNHRVILSGTPLQNNLRELFNVLYFLEPEKMKEREELENKYLELTKERVEELHEMLKPFILRRTKQEALKLPPKKEIVIPVSMTLIQIAMYKAILTKNYKSLNDKSEKRRALHSILVQLRKTVNHPFLFPDNEPIVEDKEMEHKQLINASGKMILLDQILKKLNREGNKVLLFSTMTHVLDIIEDYMRYEKLKETKETRLH